MIRNASKRKMYMTDCQCKDHEFHSIREADIHFSICSICKKIIYKSQFGNETIVKEK